jgi:hypothetical protein
VGGIVYVQHVRQISSRHSLELLTGDGGSERTAAIVRRVSRPKALAEGVKEPCDLMRAPGRETMWV